MYQRQVNNLRLLFFSIYNQIQYMSQLIHAVKHTIIGREAADLPLRERNSICCLMSGTKQGSWSCRKKIAKERGCSMRVRKVKKGQAATLYPQRHSRRIVPEEEDGCAQDEVECWSAKPEERQGCTLSLARHPPQNRAGALPHAFYKTSVT
jgi:hypothetical protein